MQSHNIEYYLHSYYKKNRYIKDLNKSNITENEWKKIKYKKQLI